MEVFKPVFKMLRVMGLHSRVIYCFRNKHPVAIKPLDVGHFVFIVSLTIMFFINIIRLFYDVITEEGSISSGLMASLSYLASCSGFFYFFCGTLWTISGGFNEFIEMLHQYQKQFGTLVNGRKIKRTYLIVYASCVIIAALTGIVFAITLFYCNEDSVIARMNLSLTSFGISSERFKIPMALWSGVWICFWMTTLASIGSLYLLGIYILYKEYQRIPKELAVKGHLNENKIRQIRLKFENLVILVHKLDKLVYHYSAAIFSVSIASVCLELYGFIHGHDVEEDYVLSAMFSFEMFNCMAMSTFAGILLTEKIHEPLDILHQMNLSLMSEKATQEVTIFITRLSSQPIGITVFGMFVIDKSSILMLSGTILTYAIVVLQLAPDNKEISVTDAILKKILAKVSNTEMELQKLLNTSYI